MKVLVQSFSYLRTGYPKDTTGKGGGFVFDCRTIDVFDDPAPGNNRVEFPFMHLTGRDPVITDALNNNKVAGEFFYHVWSLVSMDILKCLKYQFPVMTVNFGCRAGQHRSVYMAERLAKVIGMAFSNEGVEVELIHLEQAYWPKNN